MKNLTGLTKAGNHKNNIANMNRSKINDKNIPQKNVKKFLNSHGFRHYDIEPLKNLLLVFC